MTTVGVDVLGFAHGHINLYCRNWMAEAGMGIRLLAGWDHDQERLRDAVSEFDVEPCLSPASLLDRPDVQAVVIAAETQKHAYLVELSAAAGKSIVLQKPIAVSMDEADRIVEAVASAGVPFTMAWQMRVDPENLKIRELIDSGTVGRVLQIRRRHCLPVLLDPEFESSWHLDPVLNRDIFADDASHAVDFLYWMFGMPERVTARMTTAYKSTIANDNGIAILDYPNGMMAEVSNAFACAAGENTTEVVGTKGVIIQNYGDGRSFGVRFDHRAPSLKWYLTEEQRWFVSEIEAPKHQADRIASLSAPLAEFLRAEGPPIASPEDGRNALRIVLACYESNAHGKRVELQ